MSVAHCGTYVARTRPGGRYRVNARPGKSSLDLGGNSKSGRRESNPHDQLGRLGLCH
jgi:hypothetical protein